MKCTPHFPKVKISSDKKIFAVDQSYKQCNGHWIPTTSKEVHRIGHTRHPSQVMVLGVICSDGRKMPTFFVDPKTDFDQHAYYRVLR